DFDINSDKIHALNTTGIDNNAFYGTAFMSGIINVHGNSKNSYLDIVGSTEKDTKINIPLTHFQDADNTSFITFVNAKNTILSNEPDIINLNKSGFNLNFDLELTPDASAQLIFDSKIGDIIRGNGSGNLKMEMDEDQNFKIFGEYVIEQGDYLFTLQNVINKRFKIEQGGTVIWNGNPYDANLDIQANYNLKTSLSTLVDSAYYNTNDFYKKRIPIECQVFLSEKLTNPNINFGINLPTADEETKTLVRTLINNEEKQNKQFVSLLVLNSFLPEQSADNLSTSASTTGLGTVTTSELLSNQLSNWLSQISDEWDIGVNYRPGDEITEDQVEVALSTQLLNDRVSINGNVGYGGQTTEQTSDIV
ncbi:MAG: translocation/assembly module TamB, partial [Cytophagales bacterium]|nr:translocation/assembly module TamB [Cytophagales bacterium]